MLKLMHPLSKYLTTERSRSMEELKNGRQENGKVRAAAYCRVSTELEEQDGSYEIQMNYFRDKISSDPSMELVGLYGDKGKSGLKAKSRPGLQRLIADCEAGRIDLVLTKSISRFARSMADCVDLIQKLRMLQVTVLFEREGLRTGDLKSDLFLNIFAALAQEESHSISQNVTRSHEQYASEGRPFGRVAYGYIGSGNKVWQVNPDEARRVKTAFSMAAEGHIYPEILDTLNRMETQERTGVVWQQKRVRYMLRNVAYLGDYFSHATVCLTPGHQVVNRGYRNRYYIEKHHEPLVSKALFDRVQRMLDSGALISYMPMTPRKMKLLQDNSWRA